MYYQSKKLKYIIVILLSFYFAKCKYLKLEGNDDKNVNII